MEELPSGAVTFLFTDIEGSTQLVKQLRDRYGEVLGQHQQILRRAFAAHAGRELDTQGDAFFVAFTSAREALLAAIDAQRALSRHPWPDSAAVKVRMGIHTGQASPAGGRYTGLAVHRAARICAAAHGGQVLVSQATQTLLEDEEEDLEVSFRALGRHRLKDLDRPVSLYQAGAVDLPSKFPPPREQASRGSAWLGRPLVLVPAVLALAGAIAAVIAVALGSGGGGLSGVDPNNVGVIDPKTNEIVAEVPVGIQPGPIAVGRGSVWVGNLGDRTLTRVNARERVNVHTIPLDNQTPTGVAVSPRAVWVAHGFLGSISRVDATYYTTDTRSATRRSSNGLGSVAWGRGSVWAAFGNSALVRVDPDRVQVTERGYAGNGPSGIVYAEGAVWVASRFDARVYQFHPGTIGSGPLARIGPVGRRPSGIAYGESSIWVANEGDGTLTRIDPSVNSFRTIMVAGRPSAVAVSRGAVWVADSEGSVSRIDPKTNTVVKEIHIGNRPAGLAAGNGFVWVTVQSS